MDVFLALGIHTFSQVALGQNLILYVFVPSRERVMKSIREKVFLALRITLCLTIKICEILCHTKLTLENPLWGPLLQHVLHTHIYWPGGLTLQEFGYLPFPLLAWFIF